MTLADFLLARLAEREAVLRLMVPGVTLSGPGYTKDGAQVTLDAAELLADVAAKRRIVAECSVGPDGRWGMYALRIADRTLRLLAQPYAGHPDYREEWRA